PQAIAAVHWDYLEAGADCIVSASYQATVDGFVREGLSRAAATDLLLLSVRLATETRDAFWADAANRRGRRRPLVAASVGPYGAALANGAEYTGAYDLTEDGLRAFHRDRFRLLAGSEADLLACETLPSAMEARVLASLLAESGPAVAWFSFSCRDGSRISDGTPLADCARFLDPLPQVLAIGLNCTPPAFAASLVASVAAATDKPVVAYPNSGEDYDPTSKTWSRGAPSDWARLGGEWRAAGARLVGGCCRTGPGHVRALRGALAGTAG
ncbi:MAG TPA: homocysteine S-methyltransferase, partial [Vicinamibacteria bacterium]|nr:homocysteine S-methyltransferase [Vicinamibacteria bacterium]